MAEYNYVAVFTIDRMFDPEYGQEIGFTKHFVDDYPSDVYENGDYSDELKEYAIKWIVRKNDFTKKTDCLKVWAKYYTPDEFRKPLKEPACECHTYIYREDLK